ncbi:MAG: glycerol-3-phosphate responsive antiterminator [Eubacterium sp.]|nr:glycerol-3-phosphate responsive antiterminator [Candidatus Colimonas fimequi]
MKIDSKNAAKKREYREYFYDSTGRYPVIPAVKNDEWLESVITTDCDIVYVLYGNICTIGDIVKKLKDAGKMVLVHIDLISGLAPKDISVEFIKKFTEADGIISTKAHLIKKANEIGLFTVQRFFMIDQLTYDNIKKNVRDTEPDVVEMMPAGLEQMLRYVTEEIEGRPLVASGLVTDENVVTKALSAGAMAVTTTNREIWKLND